MKSNPHAQTAAQTERLRARYVAWLLCLKPHRVFPFGPECNAEADQHLVDYVLEELGRLTAQAKRSRDYSEPAMAFRNTLDHCCAVMDGKRNPPSIIAGQFDNKAGFRRGVYVFQEVRQNDC